MCFRKVKLIITLTTGFVCLGFLAYSVGPIKHNINIELRNYASSLYQQNLRTVKQSPARDTISGTPDIKRQALAIASKEKKFFYNGVNNCGSSITANLISTFNTSGLKIMKPQQQKVDMSRLNIAKTIVNSEPPSIFIHHTSFIDFERFGYANPIYFNLIREPISRMISDFNFAQQVGIQVPPPGLSLDDCFQNKTVSICGEFCNNTGDHLIEGALKYFAGQNTSHLCGEKRLQLAKLNIVQHFAVVGYLENYTQFLETLEWLFPSVFRGISRRHSTRSKRDLDRNSHTQRKNANEIPSNKTIEIMKKRLRYEFDLYNFIKARFDRLYIAYRVDSQEDVK